jgi:transcription initiation factor IIE alpha subunit
MAADMEAALALVERLIATVARAFYNDTTVVVLDILSRESYVRHEEIAPRLRLERKDVQRVLNQLEAEWLIRSEDNLMEDQRNSKCYYIDYQLFVNVVRYRVNCMQSELKVKQSSQNQKLQFRCPSCGTISDELDVLTSISKDQKFVCSSCCPSDNIRGVISEKEWTLVEIDVQGKLKKMLSLEKKLHEQMKQSELHDGIYNLLAQLKDVPLPANRPSSNIKCGFLSSAVSNAEAQKDIEENSSKMRGNIVQLKKGEAPAKAITANKDALNRKFQINIQSGPAKASVAVNSSGTGAQKRIKIETDASSSAQVKPAVAPRQGEISFLTKSGVKGTSEVIAAVHQRQLEREGKDEQASAASAANPVAGAPGSSSSQPAGLPAGSIIAAEEDDDDDDDGHVWED